MNSRLDRPTTKKTTLTLEARHFDGSMRDWPYSIRASEISRCLVEHDGLPKPQRVSFVGLHENVFIWEAFYKDGTRIAGTLMMRAIWTARKLDICSEVRLFNPEVTARTPKSKPSKPAATKPRGKLKLVKG